MEYSLDFNPKPSGRVVAGIFPRLSSVKIKSDIPSIVQKMVLRRHQLNKTNMRLGVDLNN